MHIFLCHRSTSGLAFHILSFLFSLLSLTLSLSHEPLGSIEVWGKYRTALIAGNWRQKVHIFPGFTMLTSAVQLQLYKKVKQYKSEVVD